MSTRYRLGVDLGGTKIEIVALDADGNERLRRRVATPRDDYAATLATVVSLVRDTERALGVGPAGERGSRDAGIDLARHRPVARFEFRVAQRPADSR